MILQQYDIYLADVNFEDTDEHKIRPVVQINKDLYISLVAKIISHSPRRGYGFEYAIRDWKEAGLSKPSTIRFSKTFRIKKRDLIKKIGHLSNFDITQIEESNNDLSEDYYLSKNAGNVEANIQAFNNSTFTGGLMEADSEERYFYYWGPIYLHSTGEFWSEDEQARTKATSREKAICNIKHKFFRQYGRAFNLKDEYLNEEPIADYIKVENSEESHVEDPKYNFNDIDREDSYEVK